MNTSMTNVRDYGACGDGVGDDTAAIREALSALPDRGGVLYFPSGHYRTDTINVPDFSTVKGDGAWSYFRPGCTVLSPVRADQPSVVDLHHVCGSRVAGLALDGQDMGTGMHGITASKTRKKLPKQVAPNFVFDDLWIQHFTGSGIAMDNAHVWCVRQCNIQWNGVDGIDAHSSYDGWVIDNQIGHSGRYGVHIMASATITANRIEQNGQAGVHFHGAYVEDTQVNGNHFCSERGPAIEIVAKWPDSVLAGITITGNLIRNSAAGMDDEPERDCHIRIENASGVACTGNSLHIMHGASGHPAYGIIIKGLSDSVIANNSLHTGATRDLIRDLGGHSNCVVKDNPGSLKVAGDVA